MHPRPLGPFHGGLRVDRENDRRPGRLFTFHLVVCIRDLIDLMRDQLQAIRHWLFESELHYSTGS